MQALSSDHVLVQLTANGGGAVTAEVVGLNDVKATASSQELAIAGVTELLREKLRSGKLVSVPLSDDQGVLKWFGHAKDDPAKDEYLEEIRRYRGEMNAQTTGDS